MNLPTTLVMVLFHLGAVAALFMFNWKAFATAVFLYWFCTGLGISMGFHRLLTHRSYKVPRPLEYLFAICGALTLEGGPISWVATHRIHHQNSDQPGDPHSPRDGGWWAHAGWILYGETNHNNTRVMSKYAPDLAKHRFEEAREMYADEWLGFSEAELESMLENAGFANVETAVVDKDAEAPQFQTLLAVADKRK